MNMTNAGAIIIIMIYCMVVAAISGIRLWTVEDSELVPVYALGCLILAVLFPIVGYIAGYAFLFAFGGLN